MVHEKLILTIGDYQIFSLDTFPVLYTVHECTPYPTYLTSDFRAAVRYAADLDEGSYLCCRG